MKQKSKKGTALIEYKNKSGAVSIVSQYYLLEDLVNISIVI